MVTVLLNIEMTVILVIVSWCILLITVPFVQFRAPRVRVKP